MMQWKNWLYSPTKHRVSSRVLICHFDEASLVYGLGVLAKLRSAGIPSEIYPDHAKIKKQLDFGNKKRVSFVIVIGSDEVANGLLTIKDMATGDQKKLTVDQIIAELQNT